MTYISNAGLSHVTECFYSVVFAFFFWYKESEHLKSHPQSQDNKFNLVLALLLWISCLLPRQNSAKARRGCDVAIDSQKLSAALEGSYLNSLNLRRFFCWLWEVSWNILTAVCITQQAEQANYVDKLWYYQQFGECPSWSSLQLQEG